MTISRVVGWRNYVTTSIPTNQTFPDLSPSPSPFVTYFLDNSRDFLTVSPTPNPQGRTDQAFATRSELIQLVLSSIGTSPNLLQYLSTFSRELNAPTWQSASNPIWQRFQLDNISLLGSSPTPAPSPGNAPAIKAAFGLQWSTTSGRWQYVGDPRYDPTIGDPDSSAGRLSGTGFLSNSKLRLFGAAYCSGSLAWCVYS